EGIQCLPRRTNHHVERAANEMASRQEALKDGDIGTVAGELLGNVGSTLLSADRVGGLAHLAQQFGAIEEEVGQPVLELAIRGLVADHLLRDFAGPLRRALRRRLLSKRPLAGADIGVESGQRVLKSSELRVLGVLADKLLLEFAALVQGLERQRRMTHAALHAAAVSVTVV